LDFLITKAQPSHPQHSFKFSSPPSSWYWLPGDHFPIVQWDTAYLIHPTDFHTARTAQMHPGDHLLVTGELCGTYVCLFYTHPLELPIGNLFGYHPALRSLSLPIYWMSIHVLDGSSWSCWPYKVCFFLCFGIPTLRNYSCYFTCFVSHFVDIPDPNSPGQYSPRKWPCR
jgi:hypothetical protein